MQTPWIWISWPTLSNETARRNAQRAAIVCAQRRRERDAVEAYLNSLAQWAARDSNPELSG